MAITLTIIPKPGPTPLGNNTPAAGVFADDYSKLSQGNISERDRKTIEVLGLLYELAAAGGNNYKTTHAALIQDSFVYSGAISLIDLQTAMSALAWTAGKVVDNSLSTDVPTLLKEGRDIQNLAADQIDRLILFLRAQLQR